MIVIKINNNNKFTYYNPSPNTSYIITFWVNRIKNNDNYEKDKNQYFLIQLIYNHKIESYNCIKIINTAKIKNNKKIKALLMLKKIIDQ